MNDNSLRELCEMSANRLFEQAEIAHYTPKERKDYEDSLKVYREFDAETRPKSKFSI
ncbi:hypothetical protein [Prevotella lacticifex]|uniref:Uncharacterized protein n=1 Tax=Prevotella lacticifex TaxID=2854755 RepID=A0A9R1CXK2_9BACT|nr:hypothetical protein [Prevotella lacticifex]GJG37896.1 hypothetical protein PRLR5003_30530 [Prevotella lacticifex]GJG41148.1 hypothetical protein PRLR5019_31190 [Prevotella lacticifex]GJG43379.1 hypothetical protein PRLR5025_21650 [Prevotella lacticifex]GJG47161.1 hypothetical protein PRLR5027_27560 [Prevotella lacticifex]GJG50188.1 hypothetical protein PRLR5052_26010 [Prevotella lacticifex]